MTTVTGRGDSLSIEELLLLSLARHLAATGDGRRIREAADISQTELARAIGSHGPVISRWESGDRVPRGAAAIRYGRAMRELASRDQTKGGDA